ncbi:MAG: anti-sigma factor antagonist [Gemmatimonadales bacterium]|jgi:anti-anti-sigma factor|nr:MAG: anti-sigma factor antagonist [Gemmatimonadales bacterium]
MFKIEFGEDGVIVCGGRLDAAQTRTAEAFLDSVSEPAVMDCSELEYISSAGLGALLKTQKRLMAVGGGLKLIKVNSHVNDIFGYAGFDRIFEIEAADG